jgi:hypothetical protein
MNAFLQFCKERKKAIAAGLVAAATWFSTSMLEDGISSAEWGALPFAVLAGLGVVGYTKNSASADQLERLEAWKNEP